LSVTGSLATVLWLIALRREGEDMDAQSFLGAGICVTVRMPSTFCSPMCVVRWDPFSTCFS
jgi:Na+/H+ antiporter NhaD/arsenite permease-like protein